MFADVTSINGCASRFNLVFPVAMSKRTNNIKQIKVKFVNNSLKFRTSISACLRMLGPMVNIFNAFTHNAPKQTLLKRSRDLL